jgi:peptide/nickel transport system permease protein
MTLGFSAISLAVFLGIPIGVISAVKKNSWFDYASLSIALIGISLPTFLIGILLILLFGVTLGWLPTFGRGEVVAIGGWTTGLLSTSGLKSLIMPAFTLGMFQLTLIMRLVRSDMLEVLRTDYI